ncbi:MAG: hypothetical protein WBD40_05790 [Tepidisphaeraceae bacterium]
MIRAATIVARIHMWGNRLGWGISAAIAIVVIGTLSFYVRGATKTSQPTQLGLDAVAQGSLALGVSPQSVLSGEPASCDAAQLYSEAIALYRRDPNGYDGIAGGSRAGSDALAKFPAIQRLIEAKNCSQMTLFTNDPALVIRYGDAPDLDALLKVGKAAVRAGLAYKSANRNFEAIKCYEAAFALGAKFYDERLTYRQLMAGLELMGESGVGLSSLNFARGDTTRSEAAQKFDVARRKLFSSSVQPISGALISIDARTVSRHAGDVFYIAENARERMWRVEAILSLGRMRFFVGEGGRIGDQRGAERALKRYAQDTDPVIRAAAKAALELTREQMRMLG